MTTTRGFDGKARPGGQRVPPGQSLTADFPVLSAGPTPKINLDAWRFTLKVGPRPVKTWTWQEFCALPRTTYTRDIHCVTTWSKLDTKWSGVLFDDIMTAAGLEPPTPYTLLHSFDGYSTNVPVADLATGRALLATHFAGKPLTPDHGGPARMVVPHLYFWKSAKWLSGIQFTSRDVAGFWELRGYHMYGDPWHEQRFAGDGEPRALGDTSANSWRAVTIHSVAVETDRVRTFRLNPDYWVDFTAGQYLEVRLTSADGYQAQRFYSIGSAPNTTGYYEITVDHLAGGEVSSWFHDIARPGDRFEVRGPFGRHFVWRPADEGPLLLVAGGSGIVPLMSIVRHRARSSPDTPAVLLYGARTKTALIFAEELLRREQWEPRLTVIFSLSRDTPDRTGDFGRRIDRDVVAAALARLPARPKLSFVCGSNAFAETTSEVLIEAGITPEQLRIERFGG